MVRHITYTTENMTKSAELCRQSALKHECNVSRIYTADDLHSDFVRKNYKTLIQEKGAGYFLWKPQIIWQEYMDLKAGDVLIYTDAGVEFLNNVNHLVKVLDDVMVFGGQFRHGDWCKGDVLTNPDVIQLQASAMLFRKSDKAEQFINLWLNLCQVPGYIDDSLSVLENEPGFQEHRWDQALLTEIQLLMGIKSHWWPASYCEGKAIFPKLNHTDTYPVIFNHHRRRNEQF